jgi:hypothetical protein
LFFFWVQGVGSKKNNLPVYRMHLGKFIHSAQGRVLMSIVLGFGLATLFRAACHGPHCTVFRAPPLSEWKDQLFAFGDSCIRMETRAVPCDPSKRTVLVD